MIIKRRLSRTFLDSIRGDQGMAIYIRKVTKGKWDWRNPVDSNLLGSDLGTDGITNCCRTSSNTLSIWMVDSDQLSTDNDKKIVATLATNGGGLSAIDCIFISDDDLAGCGVNIRQVNGDSLISDIVSLHYDICDLNVLSLGNLGVLINKKISGEATSGDIVSQPVIKRIDVASIKSYISTFIPKASEQGKQLVLKSGFSKVYD